MKVRYLSAILFNLGLVPAVYAEQGQVSETDPAAPSAYDLCLLEAIKKGNETGNDQTVESIKRHCVL